MKREATTESKQDESQNHIKKSRIPKKAEDFMCVIIFPITIIIIAFWNVSMFQKVNPNTYPEGFNMAILPILGAFIFYVISIFALDKFIYFFLLSFIYFFSWNSLHDYAALPEMKISPFYNKIYSQEMKKIFISSLIIFSMISVFSVTMGGEIKKQSTIIDELLSLPQNMCYEETLDSFQRRLKMATFGQMRNMIYYI